MQLYAEIDSSHNAACGIFLRATTSLDPGTDEYHEWYQMISIGY